MPLGKKKLIQRRHDYHNANKQQENKQLTTANGISLLYGL